MLGGLQAPPTGPLGKFSLPLRCSNIVFGWFVRVIAHQGHGGGCDQGHAYRSSRPLKACPGGFGTLDELFETLTLIQTRKIKPVPVLLLGNEYWRRLINFDVLVEEGMIDEHDLALFKFVDSASEAWLAIKQYYDL